MCKHILNAQVSIRAPCCRNWYDCPECHAEAASHSLLKTFELIMACKKCKKVFKKDLGEKELDEADEYCPYCDNHFVLEAIEPLSLEIAKARREGMNPIPIQPK